MIEDVGGVSVGTAAVELDVSPVGALVVGAWVVVIAPLVVAVLVPVSIAVGTSRGPVPDWGTTRVATIVECVFDSAFEIPTHIL